MILIFAYLLKNSIESWVLCSSFMVFDNFLHYDHFQIGSSIYTGKWNQTLGTDIILQSSNKVVHSGADFGMLSMPSFQSPSIAASQIDLISYSDTRLVAHKALVTSPNERTTHPIVPESTDEEQSKTKTSQTKKKSTKSPEAKKSKP